MTWMQGCRCASRAVAARYSKVPREVIQEGFLDCQRAQVIECNVQAAANAHVRLHPGVDSSGFPLPKPAPNRKVGSGCRSRTRLAFQAQTACGQDCEKLRVANRASCMTPQHDQTRMRLDWEEKMLEVTIPYYMIPSCEPPHQTLGKASTWKKSIPAWNLLRTMS